MSAIKLVTTLYNPGEKDKATLIDEFVVRQKEFNAIYNDIKTSKMLHPEQHYLLVGQRGSGKTTLMQRLKYAIQDDDKLSKQLIPIVFTEEQYNISELGNLWENIAAHLEDFYEMNGIVAEMEQQLKKDDYEPKQLQILLNYLNKHKKKIVLFIDNIGDLLEKFSEIEIKRLREVLMTIAELRLVVASPIVLDDVLDYRRPLLEFFKTIRLGSLNKEEIETLLRKLGEQYEAKEQIEKIIHQYPERIEILRRLTGGVVRTVVLIFNVFIENVEGNPLGDLKQIVDDVTPLYKHKMDDLPAQQQKIVDAVAKNWESISTKEIAEKTRLESKVISAQLKQLEKNQYVEKITTTTKNHLYQIKERFFNIWYLMRYGRTFDKDRVIWLVKFMESWLDKDELERRVLKMINELKNEKTDISSLLLWNEVLISCESVSPLLKYQLIELLETKLPKDFKREIEKLSEKKGELFEHMLLSKEISINDISKIIKIDFDFSKDKALLQVTLMTILLLLLSKKGHKEIAWLAFLEKCTNYDNTGTIDLLISGIWRGYGDINLAEEFIYKSVRKNNIYAYEQLPRFYFEEARKKEEARNLIYLNEKNDLDYKILKANICLWNNNLDDSLKSFDSIIGSLSQDDLGKNINKIKDYVLLLISKVQTNLAYKILTDEKYQLKDKMLPVYHALMHYMKDDYPNEYLRMPPEMKETVEEVMKKVEEYRVKYQ